MPARQTGAPAQIRQPKCSTSADIRLSIAGSAVSSLGEFRTTASLTRCQFRRNSPSVLGGDDGQRVRVTGERLALEQVGGMHGETVFLLLMIVGFADVPPTSRAARPPTGRPDRSSCRDRIRRHAPHGFRCADRSARRRHGCGRTAFYDRRSPEPAHCRGGASSSPLRTQRCRPSACSASPGSVITVDRLLVEFLIALGHRTIIGRDFDRAVAQIDLGLVLALLDPRGATRHARSSATSNRRHARRVAADHAQRSPTRHADQLGLVGDQHQLLRRCVAGKLATTGPLRAMLSILVMPWPPRPVRRYS